MIEATVRLSGHEAWVAGAVRGHYPEVGTLLDHLRAFAPRGVGLGISFDELTGLHDHFVQRPAEPLVPLTATETAELLGLARFGEVRVPNPAYLAVLEWAHGETVPVEALEVSDEQYSQLFGDHISYLELVGRTLRERRLTRAPPAAKSADDYALRWEGSVARGGGSQRFLAARTEAIGSAARRLANRFGRVAIVVDRERFDAVVGILRSAS